MSKFCSECGERLQAEWRACPHCGAAASPGETKEPAPLPNAPQTVGETTPPAPGAPLNERLQHLWNEASGPTTCPGCRQTTGSPGALCPQCGSRFPSQRAGLVGLALAAVGGLLLLAAFMINGGLLEENRHEGGSTVEGAGWLVLIVGAGIFIYSVGRAGPERQSSCCGCSCAVALLVVPSTALLLWAAGGATLVAFAIPLWVPLVWTLDAALALAWFARRAAREMTRSVAWAFALS